MRAKWYVYTLSDPRDGAVFYVGKGSGSRIEAHEREAISGKPVCSKKIRKIRDLWFADCEVVRTHVAFFWDEQAAYDHETDLIEEIGLENLTNVLPGGQKAWTERRNQRAATRSIRPLHELVKKLDLPIASRFAEWFRAGGHNGNKWTFTAVKPEFKWHAAISEATYNSFFPALWDSIRKDNLALNEFVAVLRPHGVELVHGSA